MSEQIDIAVDLGVLPPPLPEILNLRQLVEAAPPPPAANHRGHPAPRVQDDPGGHEQKQQELVPARPGGERGERQIAAAGLVGSLRINENQEH